MASNNFSLIFSLLIIGAVLCSTTTVVVGTPPGPRGGAPFPPIHNPVGTSPQLNKVAGRRGLLSVPGASPNTDLLASPYNNLVQVSTPSSLKSPNSPAHGSPKGGIPTPPSPKSPNSPAHGSPKGVPGASPNTNSLASPYNNLVEVPATPSKSPVHGSPKGAPPRA
ncbi:nascent polypeptide-associated complex subunit alpha, muscle-specific form-like isoform X1 [Ipomoea triloba]|uniref:nascent polypeptide-associated complex subunit alpha, muscle-specific form-like isoform X1 n=1 Tax=Ipomoea triloba TaxID=35885 RepID=UPI00125DE68B|nr:nascent polypeptide-associated complex subunit alpha, muscle-specific form-like isoform X1 [Ipomoea triloba]